MLYIDYGLKIGNYDSTNDDKIVFQCDILIIDNIISDNGTSFNVSISTLINSYFSSSTQTQLQLNRLTTERPILNSFAQFLTNLNGPLPGLENF